MDEQILLGTLLGDASIGKLIGKRKTYSIRWEHCLNQKQYAIWKANNSLNNYSIYERSRMDTRTNKIYDSITCYSIKDNYEYYRDLFYNNNIKIINYKILSLLSPLAIAVWFMDDGNLYYNGNNCHLTLAVNCFTEKEIKIIIQYFKNTWDINFKMNKSKSIRLTSVYETIKFEKLFMEYYHESMIYKTLEFQKSKYDKKLTNERRKCRNKKYK